MLSFAFILVLAIGIVLAAFALSTFLVGICRYLHDEPTHVRIDKWGHYTGCKSSDSPLIHCPEYRSGGIDLEYAHVSGPWHG